MSTFTGGIVSGIDTGALISSLVAANSVTLNTIKAQKATVSSRKDAYDTLASRLDTLKSAIEDMDTSKEFRSVTGASNSSAVGITVAGDAIVGAMSVTVSQLASTAMEVSDGVASESDSGTMATGTYSFTVAGVTTNVTIDSSSSSLDDLVSAINDQVDGVTAYVMNTGDASTPYRLVVTANSSGSENTVSIDTSGLDSSTGTVPSFTEVTAAQDAKLEVNGVSVTSSSNDVTGVIQGVTLTATDVTSSAATVTVSKDTASMVTKMEAVVTAYNSVMSYIRGQEAWNPKQGIQGSFVGELQPTDVVRQLQSTISAAYTAVGDFNSLANLGISTKQNGDIALDSDKFTSALDSGFNDVTKLFTDSSNGIAASLTTLLGTFTGTDGTITARSDSLAKDLTAYDTRISTYEDQLTSYEARLKQEFTAMELALAGFNSAKSAIAALLPSSSSSSSSTSG